MEQIAVLVSAIILLFVSGLVLMFWRKASIQTRVNQFLDLVAAEMPRPMIKKYLLDFGFFFEDEDGEALCLDQKFGPRVANEKSVARLIARAVREKIISVEVLTQEIVRHFTQKPRLFFFSGWRYQKKDIDVFTAYIISNLEGREHILLRHEIEKAVDLEIDRHLSSKIFATEQELEETRARLLEQNLILARQVFLGEKKEIAPPANPAAANSSVFTP